jgi:hypothetical protein
MGESFIWEVDQPLSYSLEEGGAPAKMRENPDGAEITWPGGKDFAFSVFDDTDHSTIERVADVYSLLCDLGMRTTKSVWLFRGYSPRIGGSTCDDEPYLEWVLNLRRNGFEIALHNVAPSTSDREHVARGLDRFRELFGHDPATFANHVGCDENIYWGAARLSGFRSGLYKAYSLLQGNGAALTGRGHIERDRLFWGDLCKARIKYVRNFVFSGVNTLKVCPYMPYTDPQKPFVNYWFASTDGPDVLGFNDCISEAGQDLLEEQRGACIMYTHFGAGFRQNGRLHPRFHELMIRLSRKNGWFVPVQQLLDHLLLMKGPHVLTRKERSRLERRWLADRYLHRKVSRRPEEYEDATVDVDTGRAKWGAMGPDSPFGLEKG